MGMEYFYKKIALKLTSWECPQTQADFDNKWELYIFFIGTSKQYSFSYTLKVYLFQFVNHYASLFYIAFVKGRYVYGSYSSC